MTTSVITSPRFGPDLDRPCPSWTTVSYPTGAEHQCGRQDGHRGYHQASVRIDDHTIITHCWVTPASERNRT